VSSFAAFTAIVIVGESGNGTVKLAAALTLPTTVTEGNGNGTITTRCARP
jgi:hypothetical protein